MGLESNQIMRTKFSFELTLKQIQNPAVEKKNRRREKFYRSLFLINNNDKFELLFKHSQHTTDTFTIKTTIYSACRK